MLEFLIVFSAIAAIVSAAFVIAFGEWKRFALKFGAVGMGMAINIGFAVIFFKLPQALLNPNEPEILDTIQLLVVAKNIDYILFNIAVGRDAIQFRRGERRVKSHGAV